MPAGDAGVQQAGRCTRAGTVGRASAARLASRERVPPAARCPVRAPPARSAPATGAARRSRSDFPTTRTPKDGAATRRTVPPSPRRSHGHSHHPCRLPARLPRYLRPARHRRGRPRGQGGGRSRPPGTQGAVHQVSRYTERTYHPDRLLTPMKRVGRKGEGKFAPIGWDEAPTSSPRGWARSPRAMRRPSAPQLRRHHGPVWREHGCAFLPQAGRLAAGPHHSRQRAGATALRYTYGASVGMDVEHVTEAKLIVIWGGNRLPPTCISGRACRKPSGAALRWWRSIPTVR